MRWLAGDPAAEVKVAEVTWTLHAQGEFMVTAAPVPCNGVPCLAFTYVEADKCALPLPSCQTGVCLVDGPNMQLTNSDHPWLCRRFECAVLLRPH